MNAGLIEEIQSAFAKRNIPDLLVPVGAPSTEVYEDAYNFGLAGVNSIDGNLIRHYPAAIYGFSPNAFAYFLPRFLVASIVEDNAGLVTNTSIIGMLDRGGEKYWDDYFRERWTILSQEECASVQDWVLWLSDAEPAEFNELELTRAFDTLDELMGLCVRKKDD